MQGEGGGGGDNGIIIPRVSLIRRGRTLGEGNHTQLYSKIITFLVINIFHITNQSDKNKRDQC